MHMLNRLALQSSLFSRNALFSKEKWYECSQFMKFLKPNVFY